MKVTMVNEYGNCFKVCTTDKQVGECEKAGFKVYTEPKEAPKKTANKAAPKATKKKAVKNNG